MRMRIPGGDVFWGLFDGAEPEEGAESKFET